jgi:hypothetical protein
VHQAQLGAEVIVVVVQALLGAASEHEPLAGAVGVGGEGEAGLDGAFDTDQALADAVARGDLLGEVFLALAVVEEEQGAAGVSGGSLDAAAKAVGGGADVGLEVLQEDLCFSQRKVSMPPTVSSSRLEPRKRGRSKPESAPMTRESKRCRKESTASSCAGWLVW